MTAQDFDFDTQKINGHLHFRLGQMRHSDGVFLRRNDHRTAANAKEDKLMWMTIISFLGGPVVKALIDAYSAKLKADNVDTRIAADLAARGF